MLHKYAGGFNPLAIWNRVQTQKFRKLINTKILSYVDQVGTKSTYIDCSNGFLNILHWNAENDLIWVIPLPEVPEGCHRPTQNSQFGTLQYIR